MEKADISVIITSRNDAQMWPMALAHIERQTYPAARFEVLVVDQCSSDDTPEIIEGFASGAPMRTRLIRMDELNRSKACEFAVREATGTWILFLAPDLLASPHLVEAHVQAQERHGGEAAIIGHIDVHPQVDPRTTSEFYRTLESQRAEHMLGSDDRVAPLAFFDVHACNLSLPRKHVLEAGDFEVSAHRVMLEENVEHHLCYHELELTWRLVSNGLYAFYSADATAYVWQTTSLEKERHDSYVRGYATHALSRRVPAEALGSRMPENRGTIQSFFDCVMVPMSVNLSRRFDRKGRLYQIMREELLKYDFWSGFRDAASLRRPRPPC